MFYILRYIKFPFLSVGYRLSIWQCFCNENYEKINENEGDVCRNTTDGPS